VLRCVGWLAGSLAPLSRTSSSGHNTGQREEKRVPAHSIRPIRPEGTRKNGTDNTCRKRRRRRRRGEEDKGMKARKKRKKRKARAIHHRIKDDSFNNLEVISYTYIHREEPATANPNEKEKKVNR
jgi:hypothetical protein